MVEKKGREEGKKAVPKNDGPVSITLASIITITFIVGFLLWSIRNRGIGPEDSNPMATNVSLITPGPNISTGEGGIIPTPTVNTSGSDEPATTGSPLPTMTPEENETAYLSAHEKLAQCKDTRVKCFYNLSENERSAIAEEQYDYCHNDPELNPSESGDCNLALAYCIKDQNPLLALKACNRGGSAGSFCVESVEKSLANIARYDPERAIRLVDEIGGVHADVAEVIAQRYPEKAIELCNRDDDSLEEYVSYKKKESCMIRVAIVISGKEGILNGTRACEHLNESKLRTDLCIVEYVDSIDKSAEAIIALITVCDQLMTDERNSCLTHLSTDFKVIDINKSIEMCNMIKTADYRTYCLEVIKKKK